MLKRKSRSIWSESDDRKLVEKMIQNSDSGEWDECREFVKAQVRIRAQNIPKDYWEDIIHDVIERIKKYLPNFEYRCTLRNWIIIILHHSIITTHRKINQERLYIVPQYDIHKDNEYDGNAPITYLTRSLEDECLIRDELRQALEALQEYISTHIHSERNQQIIQLVLIEGRSHQETARIIGCTSPVVGYVVRSAQKHVREKLQKLQ